MDVRVCPKCGMENKRSSASCAGCYTSLARVPVTQSGGAGQTSPQPPVGAAPTQMGGPPRGMPAGQPYGQPQGQPYNQPQGQPLNQQMYPLDQMPKKTSLAWVYILFGILVVVGIGVSLPGLLKSMAPKPKPKEPPTNIVMQFLMAKRTNQLADVKPYLSKESITWLDKSFSSPQARSAGFDVNEVSKMLLFNVSPTASEIRKCDVAVSVSPDNEDKSGNTAVVIAKLTKKAIPAANPGAQPQAESGPDLSSFDFSSGEGDYEVVVVNEDAKWKIDLQSTNQRQGVSKIGNIVPKN